MTISKRNGRWQVINQQGELLAAFPLKAMAQDFIATVKLHGLLVALGLTN